MTTRSALYDDLQRSNRRRSRALLAGGVAIVAVLVWLFVGFFAGEAAFDPATALGVTAFGTVVGLLGMFVAYRSGPAVALRTSRARPARREDHPQLFNVYDEVCAAAGVTGDQVPTLHIVDDPAPNAFATGIKRDDAHIAVTTGLLEQLPRYELRAVLAHELAHVTNDDIRTVTVAVATAGLVALLANVLARALWFGGGRGGRGGNSGGGGAAQVIVLVVGLVAIILAPLAAQVIRFAVSRQREYLADATAAETLRDPQSMVNALRRIDGVPHTLSRFDAATAHLWFDEPNETGAGESEAGPSHDRMPARGRGSGGTRMARRFATHPSMGERIQRLASLNAGTVRVDAPLPPPPGRRGDHPGGPPRGDTAPGDGGGRGGAGPDDRGPRGTGSAGFAPPTPKPGVPPPPPWAG